MSFLVATMLLPAVYRPNDKRLNYDRWNAARSCQLKWLTYGQKCSSYIAYLED